MIVYEYKGKSRIIWRGQEVDPSDILNLPEYHVELSLRLGIIKKSKKVKENGTKRKRKKDSGEY